MSNEYHLVHPGGECSRCEQHVPELFIVAYIETMSGPPGSAYACIPCARIVARRSTAPDWLVRNLANLDHARAHGAS